MVDQSKKPSLRQRARARIKAIGWAIGWIVGRSLRRLVDVTANVAATLISPIGFREILLLSGAALLAVGAWFVYPPAGYLVPGVVFVGVAIFGVRV